MNPERKVTGFEIAVIGMDGRFPAAPNIKRFWENLISGTESLVSLSDEELKESGVEPSTINNPDFVKTRGGALERKEFFDANFFDYSPREAEIMDPQIRLFHECSWNALEEAGYNPAAYDGIIGIYAGASANLYWQALVVLSGKADDLGLFDAYQLFDNGSLSRRVSYKLDLKGPAVVVQSACSTSLLAIHMACRALLTGECDMALAGGVTVSTQKNPGYIYQEGMILSPDGHCRAFDADAQGTVGGEGIGVVVLKRLKHAAAHRDHIHAIILASAVNNDGNRKIGYTAPSVEGQVGVIRTALRLAGVEPESIGYVETHGTGTLLGDPIEIKALTQAFNTGKKSYCGIGSVKTNIGHLDAAAGAAGFIKTVLILKHCRIPPSLNFERPNPKINFVDSPFFMNAGLREWKCDSYPLRAAVSSFGLGGTNVHLILEKALPDRGELSASHLPVKQGQYRLLLLSAKTEPALGQRIRDLLDYLKVNPTASLADVAYTLQVGRQHFKHRAAVVCSTNQEAITTLSSLIEGCPPIQVYKPNQKFCGVQGRFFKSAPGRRRQKKEFSGRPLEQLNPPDPLDQDLQPLLKRLQDCINTPDTESSPDMDLLYTKIGQAWCSGVPIDWKDIHKNSKRHRAALPTYPFEGKRYWIEGDPFEMTAARSQSEELHKQTDIAGWFYHPLWEQIMPIVPLSSGFNKKLNWLIFMDDAGIGTRLKMELEQQGQRVITVKKSTHFSSSNFFSYQVNPAADKDYETLFKTLIRLDRVPHKILHLWNVGEVYRDSNNGPGFDALTRSWELGLFSLLGIVRAIGTLRLTDGIEIEVISSNMHQIAGEEGGCPEKATLLGAVKIIPLEYFNVKCRSIDILIPTSAGKQEKDLIHQLLLELNGDGSSSYPVTALRGNRRWVQTFKPLRLRPSAALPSPLKQQGVYLITGGFGGMGFTLAEYLARTVKARLILVGRSPFPARQKWQEWLADHGENNDTSRKIRKVMELEAHGAQLMIARADVSHLEKMRRVIARAGERFGTINGVLHTAGLGDFDGVIQKRSREATRRIMAPKVNGTLVLEHLLKNMPLDFFVLFSSVGNVMYGHKFGQVGYNAANEFLDAFALYKSQNDGTITVAINWDDWLEVGMDVESRRWKYCKNPGYSDEDHINPNAMTPSEGVEVFQRILSASLPRVLVSTRDLTAMLKRQEQQLENVEQSLVEAMEELKDPDWYPLSPVSTGYSAPGNETQLKLAVLWKNFFGIEKIGINDNFFEMGGDSLKAITLLTKIHQSHHVKVPLAVFFDRPTIAQLASYLDGSEQEILPPLQKAEKKEYYRLSPAQKRLYILQRMTLASTAYNEPRMVQLAYQPEKDELEGIFQKLLHRHESLRTSFVMNDNEPVQRIIQNHEVEFEIEDYQVEVKEEFVRPFDLSRAPLLRAALLKIDAGNCLLMMDVHHIVSDGASHDLLVQELISLYRLEELPPLEVQYKDYSEWISGEIEKKDIRQQEHYWLKLFREEPPVCGILTDYPRPEIQSFSGRTISFSIEKKESEGLRNIAAGSGATLFMILLAVFNVLISKLSCQEDIVIGTPVEGRKHPALEKVIGMFVNTLALRNYPHGQKSFEEFLAEVKDHTLEAFENQYYPFEELVEKVVVNRDTSRNPLFDIMFVFEAARDKSLDISPGAEAIPGVKAGQDMFDDNRTRFDITLTVAEREDRLDCSFQYGIDLFKELTILRFIEYFKQTVSTVSGEPRKRIADIEIITEKEKEQILFGFNNTSAGYPSDKQVHQLFDRQAARTPDRIALIGIKEEGGRDKRLEGNKHLSYRELNEKSCYLASLLKKRGTGPDTTVAIVVRRSISMVMGIFAILNAGMAYLPIDPDYPKERIDYILKDSGAEILVTTQDLSKEIVFEKEIIYLPTCPRFNIPSRHVSSHPHLPSAPAASLVYIIYTSGSTGKPKGVMIEHRSVVNILLALFRLYPFGPADNYLLKTSYMFDVSITELFGWFLGGGKLTVLERDGEKDPGLILKTVSYYNITHINFVPSMFNIFVDMLSRQNVCSLSGLKYIFLAGEALSPTLVKKFAALKTGVNLENIYGPTEGTIYVCGYSLAGWKVQELRSVPIGKPLDNIRAYILDHRLRLQPLGVGGELCIAGVGLARGYINRPELTEQKFQIPNKPEYYRSYKSYILYKTGDLARWLPDGNLEFLGRIDQQVKIRGFRVELGDIESHLLTHQMIKDAVVVALNSRRDSAPNSRDQDQYLCAYYIPVPPVSGVMDQVELSVPRLREFLLVRLPEFMVPSYFIRLDKFPLTAGGKVQRQALPEPGARIDTGKEYSPPEKDSERVITRIWQNILKLDKLGIDDNFFDLGGSSLKVIQVNNKLKTVFNKDIPLLSLFKYTTIRSLAGYIDGEDKSSVPSVHINRMETLEKGVKKLGNLKNKMKLREVSNG